MSGLTAPPPRDAAVERQVHVRWDVKTGGDPDAGLVDPAAVTPTTIAALIAYPAPANWPPPGRVKPVETTIWRLDATLIGYKLETDRDYHLVLSDANNKTLIVEIPDPAVVVPSSRFIPQITSARKAFDDRFGKQIQALESMMEPETPEAPAPMIVHVSVPVHITGIGFFDFIHGQTGVAPNGVELHPVLSLVF